jgi:hypothetical protein
MQRYLVEIIWKNCIGNHGKDVVLSVLLPLSVTVQYLCSALQKLSFISRNIATKNLQSGVSHDKLGGAQQVIILMEADD